MKSNWQEITDDLVSRISVHLAGCLGILSTLCLWGDYYIDMWRIVMEVPSKGELATAFCMFAIFLVFLFIGIFYTIENIFNLKLKFKFLKNKFYKTFILLAFILFIIYLIPTFIFIFKLITSYF